MCLSHILELPTKKLIKNLDGPSLSGDKYSGPIGSLLSDVESLPLNFDFPVLDASLIPAISSEALSKLNGDQNMFVKLVLIITTGQIPKNFKNYKIGEMSQARWVTTNTRVLYLFICVHGLDPTSTYKLRLLVEFIINVYANAWFSLRINEKWTVAPKIYLDAILKLQSQDQVVQDAVARTFQTGAYWLHSEMILQHLLSEGSREDREFAYSTILQIRQAKGHGDIGDSSYRKRKNPPINMKATGFQDVIDWSNKLDLYEPVLTANIASKDLVQFLYNPMEVENLPAHTQVCFII